MKTLCLCFLAALTAGNVAAESGRLLYMLNCAGCHPLIENDGSGFASTGYRGKFVQTPKKRAFAIDLPEPGQTLSAEEDRELIHEVLAWARACPQLPPGSALTRYSATAGTGARR